MQQRLCLEEKEERLEMYAVHATWYTYVGYMQLTIVGEGNPDERKCASVKTWVTSLIRPRPDWRTGGFSTIMVTVALNLSNY
ncbi:hypothetical protein BGAL_0815g00020 [Botrytis galanthina]|uniref:Uncharacterized protein n=1 Tax=Botrytis galanthina TaxID=278940 RepID=A0A4V4HT68_9HELO|nr:hypothetical protein BGAL_0815g00020 [Botrytis galanthina]